MVTLKCSFWMDFFLVEIMTINLWFNSNISYVKIIIACSSDMENGGYTITGLLAIYVWTRFCSMKPDVTGHIAGLGVSYGISNTIVLEIP